MQERTNYHMKSEQLSIYFVISPPNQNNKSEVSLKLCSLP